MMLTGCAGIDPVEAYRNAARSLAFKLESVHPRLEMVFPLDRSALVLAVDLGVENPSKLRLAARRLGGAIQLDCAEGSFPLGQLSFPAGVELDPAARSTVRAEIRLPYGEIKQAWKALEAVALKGRAGTWKLEGTATIDLLGVPMELPLRTSLRSGDPPQ